jgi:hypothetical protein
MMSKEATIELNPCQSSSHARLYNDVLGVAFHCLTFEELHSCMRVCKGWLAVVCKMRGLSIGKSVKATADDVRCLRASRLTRHVSSLEHAGTSMYDILPHQQLACIAEAFPFLRNLRLKLEWEHLCIDSRYDWDMRLRDIQLPLTLHSVILHFEAVTSVSETITSQANAFIHLLATHEPLRELRLIFIRKMPDHIVFRPLQSSKQLTLLRIEQKGARSIDRMTQAQLADLRQLSLTTLQLEPCSPDTLAALLVLPGPPLLWTSLPYKWHVINNSVAALLPCLPHLTKLTSDYFQWPKMRSLAFLPLMSQLCSLAIDLFVYDAAGPTQDHIRQTQRHIDQALAALTDPLPQLTELYLGSIASTSAQLRTLLSLMPRLSSLTLGDLQSLHDLTFLTSVKSTLRTFIMHNCVHYGFVPSTLLQLQDLSLHTLELNESLSQPLDVLSLTLLTPPSRLFPTLQCFVYTRPQPYD